MTQTGGTPLFSRMQFTRMELAGSLGDLGTLLPISIGMVLINGMSTVGTFLAIGLFYLAAGFYFRLPVSVQPMKVIGAYAIATGMTPEQVSGATLLLCIFLAIIGLSNAVVWLDRLIPKPVVRGVQLSTGVLLLQQGFAFILGSSGHQLAQGLAEPWFMRQNIGPVPLGLSLGVIGFILTLLLLNNKRLPAALALLTLGLFAGLVFGDLSALKELSMGIHLPVLLPFGFPSMPDLNLALFVLVLPQIPMTLGNAVVASTDLAKEYFPEASARVNYRSMTISMALAGVASFLMGGIPLCHGAGGLAAHYRFGARTSGSNVIIGLIFVGLAIFFGPQALTLLHLLPLSILGVLLVFAGTQLGLAIIDMMNRTHLFIILVMLGITLISNLAWAFLAGTCLAHLLKMKKISV